MSKGITNSHDILRFKKTKIVLRCNGFLGGSTNARLRTASVGIHSKRSAHQKQHPNLLALQSQTEHSSSKVCQTKPPTRCCRCCSGSTLASKRCSPFLAQGWRDGWKLNDAQGQGPLRPDSQHHFLVSYDSGGSRRAWTGVFTSRFEVFTRSVADTPETCSSNVPTKARELCNMCADKVRAKTISTRPTARHMYKQAKLC